VEAEAREGRAPSAAAVQDVLKGHREQLDELDRSLIDVVAQRISLCREIAATKAAHGIPMMQPARISVVRQRFVAMGAKHRLAKPFMEHLYRVILDESCRQEQDIIGTGQSHSSCPD
jgi:chorismate mutase